MSDYQHSALGRSDLLNLAFAERPKYLALAWSMLGDCHSAEAVFHELIKALDDREGRFSSEKALENWCWRALRNRCYNLAARANPPRRLHLPTSILYRADEELRSRDRHELGERVDPLRHCLSRLPKKAKWIVQLFYSEGMRGLDAARTLNMNSVSFYRKLRNTYDDLDKCLRRRRALGRLLPPHIATRKCRFERLVFRYLDDELGKSDVAKLAAEMASNPDRICQFNDIRLHAAMVRDSDAIAATRELHHGFAPIFTEGRKVKRAWILSLLTTSVIVGAFVGISSLITVKDAPAAPASFQRGADAQFAGLETPASGSPLAARDYSLLRGTVQLQFAKGAVVNIEGPADFTIESEESMALRRGVLLAMVPSPAVGFSIKTDFGVIRDLGTEFGVTVQPGISSDLVVFEGEVELSQPGTGPQLLRKGQGLRFSQGSPSQLVASQEAFRFPLTVPVSAPPSSSGNLLRNASFENGPLSRAQHSDHRYRDVATLWMPGKLAQSQWSEDIPVTAAGTVVSPSTASQLPKLPDGQRCLYLNEASVRQPVGTVTAGSRFGLSVSVATPPQQPAASDPIQEAESAEYEVGLMAQTKWIASKRGYHTPGGEFDSLQFEFLVPPETGTDGSSLFLSLSVTKGTMFFDELVLSELDPPN